MENLTSIYDKAILIGFDIDGKCVCNCIRNLSDYYEMNHPWDDDEIVREIKFRHINGFLFDELWVLEQQFETKFDPTSDPIIDGRAKFSDGTVQNLWQKMCNELQQRQKKSTEYSRKPSARSKREKCMKPIVKMQKARASLGFG